jgi:hypothetical protein
LLCHRINSVHTYILSKVLYCSQVILITNEYARKFTNAMLWYIWKGNIFRVFTTTLQIETVQGDINLTEDKANCTTTFVTRCVEQRESNTTTTTAWIR